MRDQLYGELMNSTRLSFLRHQEIYQSDEPENERARLLSHTLAHRLDEFPVGYSLASCSPAELASASPTALIVNIGSVDHKNLFRLTEGVS
jgi:hypothetical protein